MTSRASYNLGVPWMTKWANLSRYTNKTSEYCGPCCDNSQIDLHHCKADVLSCMDFRLKDNQACHLNNLGYKNNYDQVIAAGSSLGYNNTLSGYEDASWNVYINSHFDLAYALHTINEIIIIEHEKCGAYGVTFDMTGYEINYHIDQVKIAGQTIWDLYNPVNGTTMTTVPGSNPSVTQIGIPNLKIIGYYININASIFTKIYEKTIDGTFVHAYVGPYTPPV